MEKREDWVRWFESMPEKGRITFSMQEAITRANGNVEAAKKAILRARRDGKVVALRKGFYSWIPFEYRNDGVPPFYWIVNEFMGAVKDPYYVGLLSAADLLGASPQAQMEYQVVVDRQVRSRVHGKSRVTFVTRAGWPDEDLLVRKPAFQDSFWCSGPELTLIDLVRFPSHSAGWDNIATLAKLLGPLAKPRKLVAALENEDMPVLQRLGWILEHVGYPRLAAAIVPLLSKGRVQPVLLELKGQPNGSLNERFKVVVNHLPEVEV